ncbi:hypothetical protein EXU57_01480 [Segetibacter sp. 3557_3]|uniref:DUF7674 family protein n=1 Tax=Segetibacter sp. 3557_3 TaxID=2547429 RepID=UPI001058FB06|nr:hypothetical protein [Segetibacter sp. 3557_3]TDH28770.1 hypothetical protein EXU57_01480 [Segetibacter sp. 3557_3]
MQTTNRVADQLLPKLPGFLPAANTKVPNQSLYKSLACLVDYTKAKILAHDFPSVKQCFDVAEGIYEHGSPPEKNAVETIFVYAFSAFMHGYDDATEQQVQSLMPACLRSAYVRQILDSGI